MSDNEHNETAKQSQRSNSGGGGSGKKGHSSDDDDNNNNNNNSHNAHNSSSSSPLRVAVSSEDILSPSYKRLSTVKRPPGAVMSGKGHDFNGGIGIGEYPEFNGLTHNKVNSAAASSNSNGGPPIGRRVVPAPPPGPGAYVGQPQWGPTRGPTRWQQDMFPQIVSLNGTARSSVRRPTTSGTTGGAASAAEGGGGSSRGGSASSKGTSPRRAVGGGDEGYSTSSFDIAGKNGFSLSSRHDDIAAKKAAQLPGPGYYNSFTSDFDKCTKKRQICAFGLRPKPLRSLSEGFPGPGTYEATTASNTAEPLFSSTLNTDTKGASLNSYAYYPYSPSLSARHAPAMTSKPTSASTPPIASTTYYKTTTMAGKWADPTPPRSPHAMSYRIAAPLDAPPSGRIVTTIKGRLAHPMDSKDALHEAAKTDHPYDASARRLKKRPVA